MISAGKAKKETAFEARARRIEIDRGGGFSAGDAKPSSWMRGCPWVSFLITGSEARSGEIRKGQPGGLAAPSLLLMPSSRLGYVAHALDLIPEQLCGVRQDSTLLKSVPPLGIDDRMGLKATEMAEMSSIREDRKDHLKCPILGHPGVKRQRSPLLPPVLEWEEPFREHRSPGQCSTARYPTSVLKCDPSSSASAPAPAACHTHAVDTVETVRILSCGRRIAASQ
ncbi:hypothetical protein V8E51_009293 [Hyaloscypha variabilis]